METFLKIASLNDKFGQLCLKIVGKKNQRKTAFFSKSIQKGFPFQNQDIQQYLLANRKQEVDTFFIHFS